MNSYEYSKLAKEYLENKKDLRQYTDDLVDKLKELEEKEHYPSMAMKNDKIQESIKNYDYYIEYINLKEKYKNMIDDVVREWEDLNCIIENLGNVSMRKIMRLRYIDNKSWKKISSEMYTSESTIFRIHRKALIELGKILESNK
ncbi:MAG: DUF1492 domain-containing protein [Peptostreptococcus porci]|uniref:DUF1492 domain-containing protein n=1 Tax=Peptostreptococcus porci TaxID=2652282 RepID=UPI002A7EF5D6|nr:DUF1492 domain-containing protein [Peptostreptococcus porci]MDY4127966.1 DUF1492 domain-containing protein [Peptostreptococcus porci]MDY4561803.1 DUF1492 domain-containing protein [Peptostreptococcus porci]